MFWQILPSCPSDRSCQPPGLLGVGQVSGSWPFVQASSTPVSLTSLVWALCSEPWARDRSVGSNASWDCWLRALLLLLSPDHSRGVSEGHLLTRAVLRVTFLSQSTNWATRAPLIVRVYFPCPPACWELQSANVVVVKCQLPREIFCEVSLPHSLCLGIRCVFFKALTQFITLHNSPASSSASPASLWASRRQKSTSYPLQGPRPPRQCLAQGSCLADICGMTEWTKESQGEHHMINRQMCRV